MDPNLDEAFQQIEELRAKGNPEAVARLVLKGRNYLRVFTGTKARPPLSVLTPDESRLVQSLRAERENRPPKTSTLAQVREFFVGERKRCEAEIEDLGRLAERAFAHPEPIVSVEGFGESGIILAGLSAADVRKESDRWYAILDDRRLATPEDNEHMIEVAERHDYYAAAIAIATDWAVAADTLADDPDALEDYTDPPSPADWAAEAAAKAEHLREQLCIADEAMRHAEAGRTAEALALARELPRDRWKLFQRHLSRLVSGAALSS